MGISAVLGFIPYFFREEREGTLHLGITIDVNEETSLRKVRSSAKEDGNQSDLVTETLL